MAAWGLAGRRVVTPEGLRDAVVVIADEVIEAVVPAGDAPAGLAVEDVGDRLILPGLVDPHVHINEPGRETWEGFRTATRAAAAGGITTLVDMPLNSSPVTTSVESLFLKMASAVHQLTVDCGFHGGLVPGNATAIPDLLRAGVCGVKAFLVDSGIDEFPAAREADLREALPFLRDAGVPLLVHAEVDRAKPDLSGCPDDPRSMARYVASRPCAWENEAIDLLVNLADSLKAPVHIVHLACGDRLEELAAARARGVPLTVETAPHYLTFAAEELPDGDPRFKCAPPIREAAHRDRLWGGLREGVIDFIATDHSPCPPELKALASGDLTQAWGGIASLQLSLPVVWTAARGRGISIEDVVRWMCEGPAALAGLSARKGCLAAGRDADLVVFDDEASFVVDGASLEHRHPVTPYQGMTLTGVVERTWLRGRDVYSRDTGIVEGQGQILRRGQG